MRKSLRTAIRFAYAPCPGGESCQSQDKHGTCKCVRFESHRVFPLNSGLGCPYHEGCSHIRPIWVIRAALEVEGTRCFPELFAELRQEDLRYVLDSPSCWGQPKILKAALETGRFSQTDCELALHSAVYACSIPAVMILLEAGVNPLAKLDGETIVEAAESLVAINSMQDRIRPEERKKCCELVRKYAQ